VKGRYHGHHGLSAKLDFHDHHGRSANRFDWRAALPPQQAVGGLAVVSYQLSVVSIATG
jgi:hypothetical protein